MRIWTGFIASFVSRPINRKLCDDWRSLAEARTTVLELLADGLLEMRLVDVPGGQAIEVVPTPLALAGGADAPQASQAASAR